MCEGLGLYGVVVDEGSPSRGVALRGWARSTSCPRVVVGRSVGPRAEPCTRAGSGQRVAVVAVRTGPRSSVVAVLGSRSGPVRSAATYSGRRSLPATSSGERSAVPGAVVAVLGAVGRSGPGRAATSSGRSVRPRGGTMHAIRIGSGAARRRSSGLAATSTRLTTSEATATRAARR